MKQILLIISLSLGFSFFAYSANDSIQSKVIIYRDHNYYGSAVPFKIFVNDTALVNIKNNSYFEYFCKPGTYSFRSNNTYPLTFQVDSAQEYFVKVNLKPGFWTVMPELILVDSISAKSVVHSGYIKKIEKSNLKVSKTKLRCGFNVLVGGGFENIAILKTTAGDDVNLSFAGGVGYALYLGYKINKHFDLAVSFNSKYNSLVPYLDNADISFTRKNISITPSLIIPIKDGEIMRLRLGGGCDKYFDSKLTFETKKLQDGFNDVWKYSSTLGYHLFADFETNISDYWSITYGLKWYNVTYNYSSSKVTFPYVRSQLHSPSGQGIDFVFGVAFYF